MSAAGHSLFRNSRTEIIRYEQNKNTDCGLCFFTQRKRGL